MPKLFVNNSSGKIDWSAIGDVVAFDEFAGRQSESTRRLSTS